MLYARAAGLPGSRSTTLLATLSPASGFAESFIHRTGHSIGTEVHGTGANMDNFESHDERTILPNTCFSVEPGIYLKEFGIRSEVDVFVGSGNAEVTTEEQDQILRI